MILKGGGFLVEEIIRGAYWYMERPRHCSAVAAKATEIKAAMEKASALSLIAAGYMDKGAKGRTK